MKVSSGTYTGTGSSQAITASGLGSSTPKFVFIKGSVSGVSACFCTNTMGADKTKELVNSTALFSGGVTSLDSGGFHVGTDNRTNQNTITFDYIAIASDASNDFETGNYTGDGADNRDITMSTITATPDMVWIGGDAVEATYFRTSSFSGDLAQDFGAVAAAANNIIQSFSAGKFQIGNRASHVNTSTVVYHWVAFVNAANIFKVLTYAGNGSDNRSITGAGFTPDNCFTKRGNNTNAMIFYPKRVTSDSSIVLGGSGTYAADQIQARESDGFQVGTSNNVNIATSTPPYYAFVFKDTNAAATATGAASFPHLTAQGTGAENNIATGAAAFPYLTAQGTGNEAPSGIAAVAFPHVTAQGGGTKADPTATGTGTFPHITVQGTGFQQPRGIGGVALPAFLASSPDARVHGGHKGGQHFIAHADVHFPHFTALGTGVKALINVGAIAFPHFTAQGAGLRNPTGIGLVTFPHFRTEGGFGAQNPAGTGAVTFPHLQALGGNPIGIGLVNLPAFMAQGYSVSPIGIGVGVFRLPDFKALGRSIVISPVIILTPSGPKLATVSIHSPWYPRQRLGVLTTANNIDRSFTAVSRLGTKDTGQGACHVSTRDPALLRDSGILTHGNLLVITSPVAAPWVGVLVTTQEDDGAGQIELSAIGYEAVLDGRVTPQTQKFTNSVGANAIFGSLIDEANARNHLGLIRPAMTEITNPVEDLEVGGQSVLEALNELSGRTDSEWWLDYQVSPQYIKALVRLGFAQGLDLSARKHYYQGTHFTAQFKADMSQVKQSVTTVGDFGADLPDRNSVTKVASFGPQHLGIGSAALQQAAPAATRRFAASNGQLASREKVTFEVMTGKTSELSRRSAVVQERAQSAERTFNATFYSNVDWRDLAAGNVVSLWGTWGGVTGQHVVRVMGLQPDEEQGVCVASMWEPVG